MEKCLFCPEPRVARGGCAAHQIVDCVHLCPTCNVEMLSSPDIAFAKPPCDRCARGEAPIFRCDNFVDISKSMERCQKISTKMYSMHTTRGFVSEPAPLCQECAIVLATPQPSEQEGQEYWYVEAPQHSTPAA